MNDLTIHHQLETHGLRCPEPIMMLHKVMRKASSGDVVEVLATDPSTSWDIPKFCMHLGHELLLNEERPHTEYTTEYRYLIQKG
ncbi:MAG: sulfurtransferase TusA [Acinetobacter sp.]|nr:sulfurtransferase TusA [Acinetobacter sp.]